MNREELGLRIMRGLVARPRLADAVFRLDKWGNIVGPDRWRDPYPIYERMRAAGPVSFSPFFQQWAVVGYDEARQVLASPAFGVADQLDLLLRTRPFSEVAPGTEAVLRNTLLFTDPPLHTRLRSVVGRAFTPKQMARLEPRIERLARTLADRCAQQDRPDVVADFTAALPIQVIGELLGVPEERWDWLVTTSARLRDALDPFVPPTATEVDELIGELAAYYAALAEQRVANPGDDLISAFVEREAEGEPVTKRFGAVDRTELVSLVAIVIFAGHETVSSALGNALVALGRNPDQRRKLQENPELWPNAVEELLRFDTAIQTDPRTAHEDTEVGGQTIRAGQNVTVMMGAANRDPRRWDRSHQLDVERADPAPISFGHGIHHCVGAALARLQLRIGLRVLVDTLGDYDLVEESLEWRQSLAFRGPTRLVVDPGTGR